MHWQARFERIIPISCLRKRFQIEVCQEAGGRKTEEGEIICQGQEIENESMADKKFYNVHC